MVGRTVWDRCLSLPCLTLVYCGQSVGWIKMKLGVEVGLGPGDIALDGDPAPPKRGTAAPIFGYMSIVVKRVDGLVCHLVWIGLSPGHIVLDGDQLPQKGHSPQFSAHVCCGQTAGWIKCYLVRR